MRDGPRVYVWIIGIALAVCLAGIANVSLRFDSLAARSELRPLSARSTPPRQSPHAAGHEIKPRALPILTLARTPRKPSLKPASLSAAPSRVGASVAVSPPQPGPTSAPPSGPAEPEQKTLAPLAYAVKANGLVEAVVSESGYVHLVHVGDTYDDRYKVTRISSDAVEMVASPAPPPASIPSASSSAASDAPSALAQAPATGAMAPPAPAPPRPLGYVEKADGTRLAVLSEGESVRLVQEGNALAEKSAPPVAPPALDSAMSPQFGAIRAAVPPLMAMAEKTGQSESAPLEPARAASLNLVPASPLATPLSADGLPVPAASHASPPSKMIGYVEKADGRVEAILDSVGGVRLVLASQNPFGPAGEGEPQDPQAAIGSAPFPTSARRPEFELAGLSLRYGSVSSATGARIQSDFMLRERRWRMGMFTRQDFMALLPSLDRPPPDFARSGASGHFSPGVRWWAEAAADNSNAAGPPGQARGSPTHHTAILESLGYVEKQDGSTFAVVENGEGEVRLLKRGEMLDHKFLVLNVYQQAMGPVASSPSSPRQPAALAAVALALHPRSVPCRISAGYPRTGSRADIMGKFGESMFSPAGLGPAAPVPSPACAPGSNVRR